jgi:Helix-turn-helix domain
MADDEQVQIRDARTRDFFILDNLVIDHYASIIGPFATLVYTAMCRHADQSTRETHPSHAFLAKKLAVSVKTVKRAINTLLEHRLIDRKHRKAKGKEPDTNIYTILEPWGRVPQTLPHVTESLREGNISIEVGSVGPQVGSVGPQGVGSVGPQVGSVGPTNKTNLKEKEYPPENTSYSLPPAADAADTREGTGPHEPNKPSRIPRRVKDRPLHDPEGYARFYAAYPRHKNPDDAMKAWDAAKPDTALQAIILEDIATRHAHDQQWIDDYIPYPATYLRGGRWRDEITPIRNPAQPSPRRHYTEADHSPEAQARLIAWGKGITSGEG